VRTDRVNDF
jgi:hypothetical protein